MSAIVGQPLWGVYANSSAGQLAAFAAWGWNPDLASVYTGQANSSDYETSVSYCINGNPNQWVGNRCVSFPILYDGVTLAQAAAGAMNAYWAVDIQEMLTALKNQPLIYVRPGWEMNGTWEDWTSPVGGESVYVTVMQMFITMLRKYDTRNQCKTVFCPNIGQNDYKPSYPGPTYIDVHAIDAYWEPGEPTDFATKANQQYGFNDQLAFAKANGKPFAISEFGMASNDLAQYARDLVAWCIDNDILFANVWDSDAAYPNGQLSGANTTNPLTAAAFREAVLANIATRTAAAPTPTPTPTPVAPTPTVTIGVDDLSNMTLSFDTAISFAAGVPQTFALAQTEPYVINLAGDQYEGNPHVSITVTPAGSKTGTVAASNLEITASHAAGAVMPYTLNLPKGGTFDIAVEFLDDRWGGSAATDCNAYVVSTQTAGGTVTPNLIAMMSTGDTANLVATMP